MSVYSELLDKTENFRPQVKISYPAGNSIIFEHHFCNAYEVMDIDTERVLLPIFWTSHYVNNDNKLQDHVDQLQKFIDQLDRSVKYFTILQYDSGTLVDFRDLDIIVFNAGGGPVKGKKAINVPIPLIGDIHFHEFDNEKRYLFNFVGRADTNNRIREPIVQVYKGRPDAMINMNGIAQIQYQKILSQSKFTLAPRGFGATSFRIWEALHYKSVPVYISDRFWLPFNEPFYYGLIFTPDYTYKIGKILEHLEEDYENWVQAGQRAYKEMFTYQALTEKIINYLDHETV